MRARGHARADELRQSRAWRLRHGGRLHHGHSGQPLGPAVPRLAAARLPRSPRRSASCSSARSTCTSTRKSHLEQVLFTIGLVFMSVAAVDYVMGSQQQFVSIPSYLQGQINLFGVGIGRYRLLIIVICGLLTVALQFVARQDALRQSACAPRSTTRAWRAGSASTSNAVFAVTFAVGSGLAGLGGALGAEILGLDPNFPLKFMIYFLIVVTVGGTSSITGPFLASLLLGIGDVAGKYYVPQFGAFIIYTIMIVVLIWRPQGLFSRAVAQMSVTGQHADLAPLVERGRASFAARARWNALEIAFWLAALATDLSAAEQAPDPDRDRDPRAVRALARPDPRLCRHRLARPRGVLRLRRLCGGHSGEVRDHQGAGARAARFRRRRGGARLRDELPGAARLRPHPPDGDARRRAGAARDREPARDHRRRRRPAGRRHGAGARALRASIFSARPPTSTA